MANQSKPRKSFTVAQANAALPLVRAIVRDITALAVDLRARHERLSGSPGLSAAHDEEREQARAALERDLERLRELEDELAELGVELKDYFLGLADFPSEMDGRPVYLCWKAGEDEVSHWHELDAGFAGRRKLFDPASPSPPNPLSHTGERGRQADDNRPSADRAKGPIAADGNS